MTTELPCFTVVQDDGSEIPSTQELRSALEKGSDEVKIETLRKIIVTTLNGNDQVRATSVFCRGETDVCMLTMPFSQTVDDILLHVNRDWRTISTPTPRPLGYRNL